MHKSKDITKYNIDWQIVRVQLKDKKNVDDKLAMAYRFFMEHKSVDNKERVINWMEGLAMGYKAAKNDEAILKIKGEIIKCEMVEATFKENNLISSSWDMRKYSIIDRKILWDDLLVRNKKWLQKGYHQNEINQFMDNLFNSFEKMSVVPSVERDFVTLHALREAAKTMENTHKFFF